MIELFTIKDVEKILVDLTDMDKHTVKLKLNYYTIKNYKDMGLTKERIFHVCCKHLSVEPEEVLTRSRKKEYVEVRTLFSKITYDNLKITNREIGEFINRDYSEVLHLKKKANEYITEGHDYFKVYYNRILKELDLI